MNTTNARPLTATNCPFLKRVKALMNKPTFEAVKAKANEEGIEAARAYLIQLHFAHDSDASKARLNCYLDGKIDRDGFLFGNSAETAKEDYLALKMNGLTHTEAMQDITRLYGSKVAGVLETHLESLQK